MPARALCCPNGRTFAELLSGRPRPNLREQSVNYDDPSDARLVEAALGGDRDAFGDLVTRYQHRLFNALLRIDGSPEDAADAAQDAFIQAYSKLASFRGESKFYTWLCRIAMNMAFSRRRRRRPTTSLDEAKDRVGEEPADRQATPEDGAVRQEEIEQVQSALANLGDQHSKILVLREIEGCSYETIADILKLPVGTVRSRLFRARMQLREKLCSMRGEEAGQPT